MAVMPMRKNTPFMITSTKSLTLAFFFINTIPFMNTGRWPMPLKKARRCRNEHRAGPEIPEIEMEAGV